MISDFSLYQLLVPCLAVIMLARVASNHVRGTQTIREVIVWTVIWTAVSLISLFPDFSIRSLARVTGAKSGLNALVFFILIILSYGCVKLYTLYEKQEQQITELTRRLAIRKFFDDKSESKQNKS